MRYSATTRIFATSIQKVSRNRNFESTARLTFLLVVWIDPKKRDIIHEHNKVHVNKPEKETCSLRRSKSLAVIREETFNELAVTGAKTRRSQLIPRAKLVGRNFFKDR